MGTEPRITKQTLIVFKALLDGREELAGADISRASGLKAGTLYPLLMRLEKLGWLSSRWETEEPSALGRPRRRLYRLTGEGAARAHAAFAEIIPLGARLQWT